VCLAAEQRKDSSKIANHRGAGSLHVSLPSAPAERRELTVGDAGLAVAEPIENQRMDLLRGLHRGAALAAVNQASTRANMPDGWFQVCVLALGSLQYA